MRRTGWWALACAALVSLVSGFGVSPESASSPEVLAQQSTTVETPRGRLQIDVYVTRDSAAGTDEYRYQLSNIDIACALGGLAISRSDIEAEPESSLRSAGSIETDQWVWDPLSAAGQIGPGQRNEFVLRVPGLSEVKAISGWTWTLRSSPCGSNKYTFTTLGPYKPGSSVAAFACGACTEAASTGAPPPRITAVSWKSDIQAVKVEFDRFPCWGNWTMFVDGQAMPVTGGPQGVEVRPNAPLNEPPTAVLIGSLPWCGGLSAVDFPCCGTIQFKIPCEGTTNEFEYNLKDVTSCATASGKQCPGLTTHEGELVVTAGQTMTLEDTTYLQRGNIRVQAGGTLLIRDTKLWVARGDVPTIHVYIFVEAGATLRVERSEIAPPQEGGLVCLMNQGTVSISDSPTQIHYLDMSGDARLTIENSELVYTIGGLLQVTGGSTTVRNSTIGALGLRVPPYGHLNASGLESGSYLESWDVHQLIPDADYELVMDKVTILKDDFSGALEHGPYERGWIFFLDATSHASIHDCELRKLFVDINGRTAEFSNLKVGVPSSLRYRDIDVSNVVVQGQWPFTINNAQVTIRDSNYLFLQPSGTSVIRLISSHMCEFIPRGFFGTLECENATWSIAGEILGGVSYHSKANDFTIRGSLSIGADVRQNLQWKGAYVTREYNVVLNDASGSLVTDAIFKGPGTQSGGDRSSHSVFSIRFDETNYNKPTSVEVWRGGKKVLTLTVDFFTATPIRAALP